MSFLESLSKVYLFEGFPQDFLEQVSPHVAQALYSDGERIVERDAINDSLWVLLSGVGVIREQLPGGLEIDIYRLQAGDLFGDMSYADSQPASASVTAEGAVRVLRLPFDELDRLLEGRPDLNVRFLRRIVLIMSQRLRASNVEVKKSFLSSLGWKEDKG
jgi:CRP-like cAMP-binding protein